VNETHILFLRLHKSHDPGIRDTFVFFSLSTSRPPFDLTLAPPAVLILEEEAALMPAGVVDLVIDAAGKV